MTPQELAALRKRQQAQREMEGSLAKKLHDAHKEQEDTERFYANKNRLVIGLIHFVGTIVIFEVIFYIAGWLFPIGFLLPYARLFSFVVAGISAFMKRSLLDGWINRA